MFSIPDHIRKLWEKWNIRGFIILSLSLQVVLVVSAPFRKRRCGRWGKCLHILIWSAYLLADWVAGVAIGFILSNQIKSRSKSTDIEVLWAPFFLLHLGGPDTITSFALEDNEFWVRHLLGLALQVGSTVYIFLMSLPNSKLWLPTILVLVAGIIKYAERNRAFYLASFEHLGDDWVPSEWGDELPIPVEFRKMDNQQENVDLHSKSVLWTAVHHFGTIKMMLVGPLLSPIQFSEIGETFLQEENPSKVLQIMEIELSLLYEVLHTKYPVVGCMVGYIFRFIALNCILGALVSFSLFKKHYELGQFDIWLTYGLLIGALLLDFISIILLIFSDWFLIAHFQSMDSRFFNKRRWSSAVSQLNFITYYVKDYPVLLKEIADFLHLRGLLEAMKGIRCLYSKNFKDDIEWRFIFKEVTELNELLLQKLAKSSQTVLEAKQVWLFSRELVLDSFSDCKELSKIVNELDYTKSVLTWHIATELCYQTSTSGTGSEDHRALCKLLSDYMFYLLVMQPATMASVSANWKIVLEDTLTRTKSLVRRSSISTGKDVKCQISNASKKILQLIPNVRNPERDINRSVLFAASALARQLNLSDSIPWESMSKVWVQLVCFAAINCRPQVHAQQSSKGGELLTFVWLLMNHLGIGTHFSSH